MILKKTTGNWFVQGKKIIYFVALLEKPGKM
jgi:hypothetical protein